MHIPVSSVVSRGAVAVTPHHLATRAALDIMASGGNAVDGALAANAMLGMVLPTTCGIGGDLFAMVHRPGDDSPSVLNASGRGGAGLDAGTIRSDGHGTMPKNSPWSITVPGCVDGWVALSERHGRRPLADAVSAAASAGEEGFEASLELSASLGRIADTVRDQPSAPALYPDARPPAPGDVLRRPALAAILRDIGEQGREAFYTGRIAEAIVGATDGVLSLQDLEDNRPDWVEPLGTEVFGLRAWTVPPNSQGYLTLAAARVLEALGWSDDPQDPLFHHAVIEAYRAVAWDRDDVVADPDHAPLAPDELLSDSRITPRGERLDRTSVTPWPRPAADPGGTAYLCVIDADGVMVSFIQSNFRGIGSGISAADTGVWLHDRGGGFTLRPGHPNEAAPGKRPLHTLAPTLWTRPDGSPALLLGTRGGHQQPQYLLHALSHLFIAGMEPAAAQAAPRWNMEFDDVGASSVVSVEARMSEAVVSGLVSRGHRVDTGPDLPPGWGPVSMISIASDGTRTAAADPRVSTAEAAGG